MARSFTMDVAVQAKGVNRASGVAGQWRDAAVDSPRGDISLHQPTHRSCRASEVPRQELCPGLWHGIRHYLPVCSRVEGCPSRRWELAAEAFIRSGICWYLTGAEMRGN